MIRQGGECQISECQLGVPGYTNSVDAGELLGDHHHDGDDERDAEGRVHDDLTQGHGWHQFGRLGLVTHLAHLILHVVGVTEPHQSCGRGRRA